MNTTTKDANNLSTKVTPIIEKEFELAIYDVIIGDSGKEEYRQVAFTQPVTVTARSQAELNNKLSLFEQCGQKAKVIRILSEKTISNTNEKPNESNSKIISMQINSTANNTYSLGDKDTVTSQNNDNIVTDAYNEKDVKSPHDTKPHYFKIGDIEVKDDNGKIYQKQWMKLTDLEAANIRVINDKNNSLVNLNGKHFEMKRWILVEKKDNTDELDSLEENLT